MERKHYIVVTAGHVDHGKSSLVKALTHTDPDRLPEEKQRGITIDLGFAHLEIARPDFIADVGIVDVPGHEDFVKNMVTGVSAADAALLVVAADDGWMPQTEEHLQILSWLGVPRLLVALSKVDRPDADPDLVEEIIREELATTPYADAPVVRCSATGEPDVGALVAALSELLPTLPARRTDGGPRLWIDRAFTLRGIGTVVTGTLESGPLRVGQLIPVQPRGTPARIRDLQTFGARVETAWPGSRVAVNLPDLDLSPDSGKPFVQRGDVVTDDSPCDVIDALIVKSSRQISPRSPANKPLKHDTRVRVHLGTGNFAARVILAEGRSLPPGESAIAELRFETPVACREGDRFTLRDWSERATLAGGRVLETHSLPRRFRSAAQQDFLRRRRDAEPGSTEWLAALLARDGFCPRTESAAEATLIGDGKAFLADGRLIENKWWQERAHELVEWVAERIRQAPSLPGIPIEEARRHLQSQIPNEAVFNRLIDQLNPDRLVVRGRMLTPPGHRPQLPPDLLGQVERIRARVSATPREPPGRAQLADSPDAARALQYLIDTGELSELDSGTVLPSDLRAEMEATIIEQLSRHDSLTTSELRSALNTTRRIAMPLLEQLDREGITLRVGDRRRLTDKGRARRAGNVD